MRYFLSFTISLVLVSAGFSAVSCAKDQSAVTAQTGEATPTPPPANRPAPPNSPEEDKKTPETPRPEIISRREWEAKAPVGEGKKQTIRFLTIHHTASLQKPGTPLERKMQNLQNFSQSESKLADGRTKPAWFDVPYHFYIAVDGRIAEGREIKFAGDTNTDYDPTGHALVVLEGNFEEETLTPAQIKALEKLTLWLVDQYKIPASDIKGHDDYASTACPGKNLKNLLPELRKKVEEKR
ncbi:MAG: peptidoglycan recognition family protein [Pyrinomonadaceae bacterium]